MVKPKNYLNNKDMLAEIHKSKTSYSSYTTKADANYDYIFESFDDITSDKLEETRSLRAIRLSKEAFDVASLNSDKKLKIAEFEIDSNSIAITDIVIRVMTWEHIPPCEAKVKKITKKAKATIDDMFDVGLDDSDIDLGIDMDIIDEVVAPVGKESAKYVRVNFPPYQHFKVNPDYSLYCVGKSHWKGDLVTGEFSTDHGAITNKLATMFLKLSDRYAMRGNWRGYSYIDEMKSNALLQLCANCLKFNEAKSDNPFAYFSTGLNNSFLRVLSDEKRNQNIRDDILEQNGLAPSYTRQGDTWGSKSNTSTDD